jgi:hypothetical protein
MIIDIIKPFGKWKVKDRVDVTPEKGRELMDLGVAQLSGNQAKLDSRPKVEPKDEVQKVEVHNHYYNIDEADFHE